MERVRLLIFCLALPLIPIENILGLPAKVDPVRDEFSLFEENGKVGLKDREGQVLIPATYDAIGWSNGKLSIVDKVVGYQSNGMWGIIHTSNKRITAAEFLELRPGEGSLLVARKKAELSRRPSFGVISTSGKTIIPFQYDGLELGNMRAVVMSKTGSRFHFGLLDLSNKFLIPLEYRRIYPLGSLRYAVESFDGKTAIFSDDGTQVTGFLIDSISSYKRNFAIIYENQRQGVIDRDGHVIVKPVYGGIRLPDNGSVEGRGMDTWFFLDGENHLIGKQSADTIQSLSPSNYAVAAGGKVQLVNNDFDPLCRELFSFVGPFTDGIAPFAKGGLMGVINDAGEIVLSADYSQVIIDKRAFLVQLNTRFKNSWVLLDKSGSPLMEKHYERIDPFNGRYYPVINRGFWGAVDANGREIVACVHDSLVQRKGDYTVVKFKNKYGIIDLKETWIVTPQVNRLEVLNDDRYFEFAGKTTFLKSFSGETVYFSDNRLDFTGGQIRERMDNGAHWIIDMDGTITYRSNQPEQTEEVFPESENLRAIRKDGKYGFIDDQGRLRIANRYEDVKPFCGGMAAIRIMNQWGFIDQQENLVVQPVYDDVGNYDNGHSIVMKEGLYGLIDKRGSVVLPLRYDEIRLNEQGRWMLRQGGSYGLADSRGGVLIHPKYDTLADTGNGYVIARRNGKSGLLTLQGVNTVPMIYDDLVFDANHGQYMALKRSPWETILEQRPQ